jgi:hypothetical protein
MASFRERLGMMELIIARIVIIIGGGAGMMATLQT